MLAAQDPENQKVPGLVCLGYPFYAIGKKDKPRIEHLQELSTPTLIVQGDRDAMGDKAAVSDYSLAKPIELCWLADGNHDLKPRKTSGYNHRQHIEKAADVIAEFITALQVRE